MKLALYLWCTISIFLQLAVLAESPADAGTAQVVASGAGVDSDKALRNALMNAVEQAVGMVVDAETLVKNEEIVKDQVLTYSDGYVEKFEKLKEGKRDDGLFEVKIKAIIKRRQLVEKLRQSKVITAKVEGQSLFGEVITQQEAARNASAMLEKAFDGLPRNLLTVTIHNQRPTIERKDPNAVVASWNLSIGYNMREYEQKVMPVLEKTLEDIAVKKGSDALVNQADISWGYKRQKHMVKSSTGNANYWRLGNFDGDLFKMGNNEMRLLVYIGRNANGDNTRWKCYVLDADAAKQPMTKLLSQSPRLKISFHTSTGQVIREEVIRIGGRLTGNDAGSSGSQRSRAELNTNQREFSLELLPLHISKNSQQFITPNVRAVWPAFVRGHTQYVEGNHDGAIINEKVPLLLLISPFVCINGGAVDNTLSDIYRPLYGNTLECKYTTKIAIEELKDIVEIRCSFVDGTDSTIDH